MLATRLNAGPVRCLLVVLLGGPGGGALVRARGRPAAHQTFLHRPAALLHTADAGNFSTGGAGIMQTFAGFYNSHTEGRGIWKWSNALAVYQHHFGALAGHQVDFAEVGVQSGGSLLMWKSVFGPGCHVFGLDINPQCLSFQDATTTITIGDQGDPNMWNGFFTNTCHSLDVLIDDGGHEPQQMLTTLTQVFPRLNSGGSIAIEDIHGISYVQSFFAPAATFIAQESAKGQVDSVHLYPFLLLVKKAGRSTKLPNVDLAFAGSTVTVDSFAALWAAVPNQRGGTVVLVNAGWGPFLTQQGLFNFFAHFGDLHGGSWIDAPVGCFHTAAAQCTATMQNSELQKSITGVHIYPERLVVEVAISPPVIQAVRRGTEWLKY